LTEYLKGLTERFQVVVLTVKTPEHSHIVRYEGARLLRVPVGSGDLRSRMEAYDRAVRRQLESEEYALAHFFDPIGGYPLCERRSEFGYKLVYDASRIMSAELPSLFPKDAENQRLIARTRRQELYCLMSADAVIVASETAKTHCRNVGVPESSIEVIPPPVDLSRYDDAVIAPPHRPPIRLIHVGNHALHHDFPFLLEGLRQSPHSFHLVVLGPSSAELTPFLKDAVTSRGLEKRVELQDPVSHDDLHKVLASADVGVVTLSNDPNHQQLTGLARIGEYLAAGRPILAAETALTRELAPASATRFYRPGDLDSLVSALDTFADAETRTIMARNARAAASAFDAQISRSRLWAVYERVAPNARGPWDGVEGDPTEATQLGRPTDDASESTQSGRRLIDVDPGTQKVKTDPAAPLPSFEAGFEAGTERAVPQEPPSLMGKLIHADTAPETTDPSHGHVVEPPVIMGLPLHSDTTDDHAPGPQTGTTSPSLFPVITNTAPPAPLPNEDETRRPPPHRSEPTPTPISVPSIPRPPPSTLTTLPRPNMVGAPTHAGSPEPAVLPTGPSTPSRGARLAPGSSPSGLHPADQPTFEARSSPPRVPGEFTGRPTLQLSTAHAPLPSLVSQTVAPPNRSPPTLLPSTRVADVSGSSEPAQMPALSRRTSPPKGSPVALPPETRVMEPQVMEALRDDVPLLNDHELHDDELRDHESQHQEPQGGPSEGPPSFGNAVLGAPVQASNVNGDDSVSLTDSSDEIDEGEIHSIETLAAPPPSRLDPWFAQLVHGYCPPQSQLFTRHVPPTTTPGKNT
jgi:glycosyltransferase involved in cell wall biosynthesis